MGSVVGDLWYVAITQFSGYMFVLFMLSNNPVVNTKRIFKTFNDNQSVM